jgi:hypothetical protein
MNFHPRISLLLDRLLLATERGSRIARIIKRVVEDMFIPKKGLKR